MDLILQILKRFESDLYNSSDKVTKDRLHYAKMWLDYAGEPPWHRDKVVAFLKHLKEVDPPYSDGTVAKIYGIVKRVFDAALAVAIEEQQKMIAQMDIEHPQESIVLAIKALGTRLPTWEMGKRASPKITQQNTPTLTLEGLKKRIEAVKDDGIGAGFLSLSSIYGYRRGELQRIRPEDFDWSGPTLFVHTEKGGDQRRQLLASEIVPLLKECDFSRQYSDWEMSKIWWDIEKKARIKHELDTGWHCVPTGTPMYTLQGYKPIEAIFIGEKVWGRGHGSYSGIQTGKFSRVLDTFSHEYNGSLIQIYAHGLLLPPVTPNQPFLIKKKNVIRSRARNKAWRRNISYVEASSITKGDYLVVPKFPKDGEIQKLDFSPYVKRWGWGKVGHLRNGVKLDEDVADFLGRYLADGGGSKASNQLYFGHDEYEDLKRYASIIKEDFGFESREDKCFRESTIKGKKTKGWCWRLQFGGEVLRRFLKENVKRNAHDAQVPTIIFKSPISVVLAFLRGYFGGDGYLRWYRSGSEASTACLNLAYEIQLLGTKADLWFNLRNPPSDLTRFYIGLSKSDAEIMWFGKTGIKTRGAKVIEDAKNFYCPIISLGRIQYEGKVHNVETRQKNYCLGNAVSHNSGRRYLDTVLRDIWGENSIQVKIFMRWRTSSSSEMTDRYYHKDPLLIDKEVLYNGHPIVTLWGNSNASQSAMKI